jgi:hypothetical protein
MIPRLLAHRLFATVLVLALAWAFWAVFFVGIAWTWLRVPMGLGGAVYPVLFTLPVVVMTGMYQRVITLDEESGTKRLLMVRILVPLSSICLGLVALCPMDSPESFLAAFWRRLLAAA